MLSYANHLLAKDVVLSLSGFEGFFLPGIDLSDGVSSYGRVGWETAYANGFRTLTKGGLVGGFNSEIVLIPELKLGVFVNDLAFGTFLNFLKYKLEWLNKKLVKVDKYFPSSQLCSECGYRKTDLLLKTKSWVCPNCGVKHNRDHNAAINIKKEGMRMILNPSN